MVDYSRLGNKTLLGMLTRAVKQKHHKKAVMRRHVFGTSYYTRAYREWLGYCNQQSTLSGELIRRGLGPEVSEIANG